MLSKASGPFYVALTQPGFPVSPFPHLHLVLLGFLLWAEPVFWVRPSEPGIAAVSVHARRFWRSHITEFIEGEFWGDSEAVSFLTANYPSLFYSLLVTSDFLALPVSQKLAVLSLSLHLDLLTGLASPISQITNSKAEEFSCHIHVKEPERAAGSHHSTWVFGGNNETINCISLVFTASREVSFKTLCLFFFICTHVHVCLTN